MRKVFAKVYIKHNDLHQKLFSHNSNSIVMAADGGKSRTGNKQGELSYVNKEVRSRDRFRLN